MRCTIKKPSAPKVAASTQISGITAYPHQATVILGNAVVGDHGKAKTIPKMCHKLTI